MELTAIDCHAHVMRHEAKLADERHSEPKRDVLVEEYLDLLDRHGVSHGVLTAPSFYGTDNAILLDALTRHPDRLRGTAIVAPESDPGLLQGMAAQGVVGIRLNWLRRRSIPDVAAPEWTRLFATLRELDWQVEIFLEDAKLAGMLPVVRRSGVRVVLDHFGCPDPVQGVASPGFQEVLKAVAAGDTWVKLSAPYRLGGADPQHYVDALMQAGGPERLVWASDWPWVNHEAGTTYRGCLDWLHAWVPDEAARRSILADTPRALFRF